MSFKIDTFENIPEGKYVDYDYDPKDFNFYELSSRPEGLLHLDPEHIERMLFERDNIEDIVYISTFIQNKEVFSKIIDKKAEQFKHLVDYKKEEAKNLAQTFKNILSQPAEIHELSDIRENDKGTFIAYIQQKDLYSKQNDHNLIICWKNETDKTHHLFESSISRANIESQNVPHYFRFFGHIETSIEERNEEKILKIRFSGDSSKSLYHYTPKLLEYYWHEIMDKFKEKKLGYQIFLSFEPPLETKKKF
jgi:hypothetical protein